MPTIYTCSAWQPDLMWLVVPSGKGTYDLQIEGPMGIGGLMHIPGMTRADLESLRAVIDAALGQTEPPAGVDLSTRVAVSK